MKYNRCKILSLDIQNLWVKFIMYCVLCVVKKNETEEKKKDYFVNLK